MTVDIHQPMRAKGRRIWRRRAKKRDNHTIRCAQFRGVSGLCNCNAKQHREHGLRERADKIEH